MMSDIYQDDITEVDDNISLGSDDLSTTNVYHGKPCKMDSIKNIFMNYMPPDMYGRPKPYSKASLDSALFHFLFGGFWFMRKMYQIRSFFSQYLSNIYFVPKFISPKIPWMKHIYFLSIGELLLTLVLLHFIIYSAIVSFSYYDVTVSGKLSESTLLLIYLMATRTNSLFTFLLGIPFERILKWHKVTAVVTIITGAFHTYAAFANDHKAHGTNDIMPYLFKDNVNMAGSFLFLSLCALTLPNIHPWIRRHFFEHFYNRHVLLAIIALATSLCHALGQEKTAVAIWWFLDAFVRYVIMARFRYRTEASLKKLSGDVVEISFPKPAKFDFNAGQYVMICIPEISIFEFHPFSLSSAPHEDKVTIHVRALGNWTRALADLSLKSSNDVKILIEGPYGNLSVNLENESRYKMVLLISGGIGITPMQSICNDLIYQVEHQGRPIKKIYFLWSVRDKEVVDALSDSSPKHLVANRFTPDLLHRGSVRNLLDAEMGKSRLDNNDYLYTDYYVTNTKATIERIPNIKLGRPDLNQVFERMRTFALKQGERHVAVCVCGPSQLVEEVKVCGRKYSTSAFQRDGVRFDVHTEVFEF